MINHTEVINYPPFFPQNVKHRFREPHILPTMYPLVKPLPSGKHTKSHGKIHPFLMGKLTLSMAICNSCVCLPEAMNGWILLLPFGTLCTNPRKSQVGGPDSIVDHMMYGSRVWGPVFVGNKPTVWATANSCR